MPIMPISRPSLRVSLRPLRRAALAALLLVMAMSPMSPAALAQDIGTPAAAQDLTTVQVVQEVQQAVVTVINEQTISSFGDSEETQPIGAGTGFIIDTDGHIVTNWHVVAGGEDYTVILADGTEVEAELIGEDPRDDLAVIQIDAAAVPDTVPLGNSDQIQVGETVLAIGSPLESFQNTVTQGIVGSLDRDGFGRGGLCFDYANLIQHDAAINPGNSGGPLFNLRGEVIGVNTLGLTSTQTGEAVQGLGFAIPSNTVISVAQQLIENGEIPAPYLGIQFAQLDPAFSAANDLPVDYGIYVIKVTPDGPADEAGIEPDDINISFGGEDISAERSLSALLTTNGPGAEVDVTVLRGGEEENLTLTVGEVPDDAYEACIDELQGEEQP